MRIARTFIAIVLASLLVGCQTNRLAAPTSPPGALQGVWRPSTYVINDENLPLDGVMVITPRYLVANTTFRSASGDVDANANSGSYYLEDGHIVMNQWMQLHYRPKNQAETFLAEDVIERIRYELRGDTLTFLFPSGNRYILHRLKNDVVANGPEDLQADRAR